MMIMKVDKFYKKWTLDNRERNFNMRIYIT